ncbi:MAG TPA: alpha/beta hydrolase domain-containing protein, partial [Verrucomicrobiae bacterium]|nr:alpha/beta hydrolase domain-containing protein [Verrucomicrobiae bacterium]
SAEFWGLRMSPGLVGTRADVDLPLPDNVRRYYFPGTTHGGGRGGFVAGANDRPGRYELPLNPNPQSETMRALFVALTDWVTRDVEPPSSAYPRLDRGELVRPDHRPMGFPPIPGQPLPDNLINPFYDYDFGPEFNRADVSGVMTRQPPIIRGLIPQLVPTVDSDGNETSGVASVLHQAPLGTYLGWNVNSGGFYQGHGGGFQGGYIPFAETRAARLAAGDPRPSIEERYTNHAGYVAAVQRAAEGLVQRRFLLPEDASRLVKQAETSNVLKNR